MGYTIYITFLLLAHVVLRNIYLTPAAIAVPYSNIHFGWYAFPYVIFPSFVFPYKWILIFPHIARLVDISCCRKYYNIYAMCCSRTKHHRVVYHGYVLHPHKSNPNIYTAKT